MSTKIDDPQFYRTSSTGFDYWNRACRNSCGLYASKIQKQNWLVCFRYLYTCTHSTELSLRAVYLLRQVDQYHARPPAARVGQQKCAPAKNIGTSVLMKKSFTSRC
jgi:hypothetical protein